jgi:4-hydroxythreonine-4-phosphate dehydrogenase
MPSGRPSLLPIALTMGEPAGIGPDISIMIWARRRELGVPLFYCIGDPRLFASRAQLLGVACPIAEVDPARAGGVFERALPVMPLVTRTPAAPGSPDARHAATVSDAIRRAVDDVRAKLASAVVTNPIHKATMTAGGFAYPGHTEFLAQLASAWTGKPVRAVMMLAGPKLRTVPVTVHIPLAKVSGALTEKLIVETGRIVAGELRSRFGVAAPRLAVAGLNPHAGEGGTIGDEEERIVRPAVAALVAAGIVATGPLPADTLFREAALATYDAALCMYHDQALIPVKSLAFAETVNVTLGLPFVRTSPDHGTALDLAGTGRADPANLLAAMRLAADLASRTAAA